MFGIGTIEALSRGLNWLAFSLAGFLLPAEHFGVYAIAVATFLIFSALGVSGQDRVILRYFQTKRDITIATFLIASIGALLSIATLFFIVEFNIISLPISFGLLTPWIFFSCLIALLISIARTKEDVVGYAVMRGAFTACKFSGILIIILLSPSVNTLLMFECCLAIVFCLIGCFYFKKTIKVPLTKSNFIQASKFGLPFILHIAAGASLGHIDKLMLSNSVSSEEIAQYSFLNAMAGGMFFIYAILNVKNETKIYNENNPVLAEVLLARLFKTSIILACFALVLLNLFLPLLLSYFNKHHLNNEIVLIVLSLAYFIYPLYLQSNIRFAWYEKPMLVPLLTISSAVINIICNIFLIPLYGILGAAISTLISYIVLCSSTQIVSRRLIS